MAYIGGDWIRSIVDYTHCGIAFHIWQRLGMISPPIVQWIVTCDSLCDQFCLRAILFIAIITRRSSILDV